MRFACHNEYVWYTLRFAAGEELADLCTAAQKISVLAI